MYITPKPTSVLKILLILFVILLLSNLTGIILRLNFIDNNSPTLLRNLIKLFDFDTERNMPTLFSSILLLICASLLGLIGLYEKQRSAKYMPWLVLSLVFTFISLDEILTFHEQLAIPVRTLFNTSGVFYFAWIIPYGIVAGLGLIMFYKFFMSLPRKTLRLFLSALVIFFLGAVGMEMLGGRVAETTGMSNLNFYALYTIEESLEMIGTIIFLYALLTYREFSISINEIPK